MGLELQRSRSEFVTLRGRRYHLRVWGEASGDTAPTIFFLHGWGDVGASFQFVVDTLRGNWRVIAPDWRGFGLTQWNDGAYWFADYLADLDALLEQCSPGRPARLVGHSMGGIVASLYAGIRPERVARLANLEGLLALHEPQAAPERLDQWLQQIRSGALDFRRYRRREEFAARLRQDNPRLTAARAAFLAEHLLRADGDGFVFAADPRHRWLSPLYFPLPEARACWRRISAPVLWVAGADSRLVADPASAADDEARACFADQRAEPIADCGHNLHHDQPEALARRLEEFFERPDLTRTPAAA